MAQPGSEPASSSRSDTDAVPRTAAPGENGARPIDRSTLDGATATAAPVAPERTTPAWRQMFASLRHDQYRTLMSGMLPSLFGMQMGMVAFSYVAYTMTGSATTLGLISLAWGVPMLVFSLFGGVVADRFPRRRILIMTQATIGLTGAINAILILTGSLQVWHLFVVGFIQGTAFSFNMPVRIALIGEAVGRDDMANAVALNNAALNGSRVAGPALAGFLIASPYVGPGGVFVLMAIGYAYVIWTISRLAVGRGTPGSGQGRRTGLEQLTDGLSFIRHSPTLMTLMSLAFVPILLGMPYITLIPVFALSVLDVGAEGMGLMQMANGVGALIGSLGIAALSGYERKGTLQLGLGILFGLCLIGFALSGSFVISLLTLAFVGMASAGYAAINSALLMANTPREMYGRVMSVTMMTFALMPLGSLPAARLADTIGPQATIAGAGALLALVIGAVALLVPSYRQIR